jgi:hypothetical protein
MTTYLNNSLSPLRGNILANRVLTLDITSSLVSSSKRTIEEDSSSSRLYKRRTLPLAFRKK